MTGHMTKPHGRRHLGTTEKIFQSKTELFDVFVDNQNITTGQTRLEPLLKLTAADEQRYQHLNDIR